MVQATVNPTKAVSSPEKVPHSQTVNDSLTMSVGSTPNSPKQDLATLFEILLEAFFPDYGLMLLNDIGEPIQSNPMAEQLLAKIKQSMSNQQSVGYGEAMALPQPVQTLCQLLIKSCKDFPTQKVQLQDDIFLEQGIRITLNAKWIELPGQPSKCIFIILEDLTQKAHYRSLYDIYRYGLTPREAETWELYLQGLSYKSIGKQLYIETCTVKKHLRSVKRKREREL